jgi:hypothetical protein
MNEIPSPRVDSFRFGRIVIDGRHYRRDVIIFPGGVKDDWSRVESHRLSTQDLAAVFEKVPQTLIIGTGVFGSMKVAPETLSNMKSQGIEALAFSSPDACEEYNRRREQERIALAIHLTC